MLVEDIAHDKPKNHQLKNSVTVQEFKRISQATGQIRYPVTDEWNRVIGIVGVRDVEGLAETQPIEKAMTRNPVTASMKTSLASAAQIMMWEGIDFLPIVDRNRKRLQRSPVKKC